MTISRNISNLAPSVTTSGALPVLSNGSSNITITPANGAVVATTNGSTALTIDTSQNATLVGTLVMGSSFLRNRLINGNMYVAQRATSATVTAGTAVPTASTGYPCVDRWFVYSTGANVTAAQVAGSGSNLNLLQVTGAASVTAVGIGQRIEQLNSIDLAGQTCTLSVSIANSLLTTVTWTASYATTADTFGTIGTPTKTQIATGTFTVTSTLTRYTANISVPAAATTGIEILFTVGAQTSGTWQIGNAQLEIGTIATPFERQIYSNQLAQCQRYYQPIINWYGGIDSTTLVAALAQFNQTMRAAPTVAKVTGSTLSWRTAGTDNTSTTWTFSAATLQTTDVWFQITVTASGGSAGGFAHNRAAAGTIATASAEL